MNNGYKFGMQKALKCKNLVDIRTCRSLVNKMATCDLLTPKEFLSLQYLLAKQEKSLTTIPNK